MKIEIACFNKESVLIAAEAGVDRVELCASIGMGGLTPSVEDFVDLKAQVDIPIFVMIRPRGGHFCYTREEIQQMRSSLKIFRKVGAEGFVFGALTAQSQIDLVSCEQLLELAEGLPCTFHRAIDSTKDIQKAMNDIVQLGFSTVLTTGGGSSAFQGLTMLKRLKQEYGESIIIMPGGGIRAFNAPAICQKLQPDWIHSSAVLRGDVIDHDEVRRIVAYLTSS